MGMPNSKFGEEIPNDKLQEGSVPSTPILTPKTIRAKEMDPRSPSLHIARTPLELLSAAAEKLELYDTEIPLQNKNLILGIDPRSPTMDFKRTPIILNHAESDLPKKIHNKNLDKVRLLEIQTTPKHSSEKKCTVPPKLLESSPIKTRPDAHKRRSLVGLLETNLDFTETDLDRVLQEKCKIEQTDQQTDLIADLQDCKPEQEENCTISETVVAVDPVSSNNVLEIPEDIPQTELNCEVTAEESDVHQSDSQIENESSEHEEIAEEHIELEKVQLNIPNKIKSAPPSPLNSSLSMLHVKEVKSEPVTPPFVNLTANVKELDKKLTNLIYEDVDLVVCPRIVQLKENVERSPLKNCNGNELKAKSAQKLKVSDKPRKSEYAVSRIPVFKEKRSKARNEVQCENTPPRNVEKNKLRHRKSDWDTKDTTLYL